MPIKISLHSALKALLLQLGAQRFREHIQEEVGRRASQFCEQVDPFLKSRDLIVPYRRALQLLDLSSLANCLNDMGIKIAVDELSEPPWDELVAGETILLVAGKKKNSPTSRRAFNDWFDDEAMDKLKSGLTNKLRDLGIKTEPVRLEPDMPPEEAATKLKELTDTRGIGMIIAVGSERANPLAYPIAKTIAADYLQERFRRGYEGVLPARFRWSDDRARLSVLSEDALCKDQDVGIRRSDMGDTDLHRTTDEEIARSISTPKCNNGAYKDCGIIMIACHVKPVLIGIFGHGGWGTVGSMQALLKEHREIARRIYASRDSVLSKSLFFDIGESRLFEVIRVHCKWPDNRKDVRLDQLKLTDASLYFPFGDEEGEREEDEVG